MEVKIDMILSKLPGVIWLWCLLILVLIGWALLNCRTKTYAEVGKWIEFVVVLSFVVLPVRKLKYKMY